MNKTFLGIFIGLILGVCGSIITANFLGIDINQGYNVNDKNEVNLESDSILESVKSSLRSVGVGSNSIENNFNRLSQIWDILQEDYHYKDKLNFKEMKTNAIKSFVGEIDDPHTIYLSKEENSKFQKGLEGGENFEGIGAVVTKVTEGIRIEELIKDSPAYKADLRPFDIITKIEGDSTEDMSLQKAVKKIRGKKGTIVELTILRKKDNGNSSTFNVKVERGSINVPSVRGEIKEISDNYNAGYIDIAKFSKDTKDALDNLISDFKNSNKDYQGVILDLRGNGGGFLPMAVKVASYFVPEGKVVLKAKYRTKPNEEFKSKGYGTFEGMPLVVLINGRSASASEILAGALREIVGADLVGTTSFGKGSIQTLHDFPNGASLKYTIGEWLTPEGQSVQDKGVKPDYKVKFDKEQYEEDDIDSQLKKAKEILKEKLNN